MSRFPFLTPRVIGAGLGLLAAAATSAFVIWHLAEAARPASTTLSLRNGTDREVQVAAAQMAGKAVAARGSRIPARSDSTGEGEWNSGSIDLEPGRAIAVRLSLVGTVTEAACTLEPRPLGQCAVRARFKGTADLHCDYDCKTTQKAKP